MHRESIFLERRLAAILAADVVGYSKLMGEDQVRTLDALRQLRKELFEPVVTEHSGTVIKRMGDGWIVEFASVSDGVDCAIRIQEGLTGHEVIRLRVGIHIGEVVIEDEDIYGDGVNVAARLEALAEPGQVVISDTAHNSLDAKATERFFGGKSHELKNIARPVAVWHWPAGGEAKSIEATVLPLPDKPSIAVLPFDNMSGDTEQEYFSDGIAEDIITDLSKISGLIVVARNSSFAYKGSSVDIRRVARDLGVAFVLEGSVRRAANRVRITAQLIEGAGGAHLWAERFDRDLNDIFAIQDEITREVVGSLKVTLRLDEHHRIGQQSTSNMEAYDLALRGIGLIHSHEHDSTMEARILLEQALALDPNYILPYFGLSVALGTIYTNNWDSSPQAALDRGYALASKAVEIDPQNPQGHWALSLMNMWKHELDIGIAEAERAIELAPNMAEAHAILGYLQSYAGRSEEAILCLQKAMRLDPKNPDIWWHFLGHAYFIGADYIAAVEVLERRIRRNPATDISRVLLAACYGHLDRKEDAKQAWDEVIKINPEYSLAQKAKVLPYKNNADWERLIDGLRKAGITQD